MLKKIWNAIVGEVKTVEGILADFHAKINELEQHIADQFQKITHFNTVIEDATAARDVAAQEINAAAAAAQAISNIVKPVVTSVADAAK